MVPKRRFWKAEPTVRNVFFKSIFNGQSPKWSTLISEKCFENTVRNVFIRRPNVAADSIHCGICGTSLSSQSGRHIHTYERPIVNADGHVRPRSVPQVDVAAPYTPTVGNRRPCVGRALRRMVRTCPRRRRAPLPPITVDRVHPADRLQRGAFQPRQVGPDVCISQAPPNPPVAAERDVPNAAAAPTQSDPINVTSRAGHHAQRAHGDGGEWHHREHLRASRWYVAKRAPRRRIGAHVGNNISEK